MNVGYVGGSITQLAVAGYRTVGGRQMWPAIRGYGGGTVLAWSNPGDTKYWRKFDQQQRLLPADVVWWQLAMKDVDVAAAALGGGLWAKALAVVELIAGRCPGIPIEAAPFASYTDTSCKSISAATFELVRATTERLIAEGHVAAGPSMPPLRRIDVDVGGCHQNLTGQALHGRTLLAHYR